MGKGRTPYGLQIIQSCLACPIREGALFCDVADDTLADLDKIRQTSLYPAGAVLFVEGELRRGIFVLCSGRVKLTASSPQGRSVIIRIASSGEVLGLSATISDTTYVATAETLDPAQVNFIPRDDFLRFLERHGEVAIRVARHLSMELRRAYQQVGHMVLSPTARTRLAGLLLETAEASGQPVQDGARFHLRFTHQEIGEIVGTSRETVSRILSDFRREGLIQIRSPFVTITDTANLKSLLD